MPLYFLYLWSSSAGPVQSPGGYAHIFTHSLVLQEIEMDDIPEARPPKQDLTTYEQSTARVSGTT